MLGRLQMPVKKAIAEYAKLMKKVFSEKKMSGPTVYKGTKLRQALKEMIREATGDGGEMMAEGGVSDGCKTAVFAMARHNLNAGLPVMFRSYNATTNPGPNCAIWQALYATMAHPDLFKSIDIVDSSVPQSFVSGELGCSNPLRHVLFEVKRIYPDRQLACIISIGAGHARTIQVPNPGRWHPVHRIQDVTVMEEIAKDSEQVAEEMALRFQGTSGVYFRFNVDQGMQNMKDGSWERLGEATQHTNAYLQKSETNQRLQDTDENTQVIACITGSKDERRVCVVYGLGGVGKTQLVLNVIEHTWEEWDHIIYIDASSEEAVEEAFKEFAVAKCIGQAYTDVISWLDSGHERWLIVFDNADTPSTNIRRYIPTRGRRGSVLITTRLSDLARLAEGPNSVCHLSSMSKVDGLALLVKSVSVGGQCLSDDDMIAAEALVEDFGCLALAIVHAGAYIAHSPNITTTEYRTLFLSQRQRMLEEYRELPVTAKLDDYGQTVYTTWRMCYDQLRPESRPLLWLFAYLHYDGIFEDIFKRAAQNMPPNKYYPLPLNDMESQAQNHVTQCLSAFLSPDGHWDTIKFARATADLTSYSLIDFDRMNLAYRVHVLVHDWARTVVPQASELAIECTATILSLSIDEGTDTASLAFKRRLGLHVTNVLTHNPDIGTNHRYWLRNVYRETGQWDQQAKLERQVLGVFQQELGDSEIATWKIMNGLAMCCLELGQLGEAEQLQVQAADAYKRLLGEGDPYTLVVMGNLAEIYSRMGRTDQAKTLLVRVIDAHSRLRGEEDLDTLTCTVSLASTYRRLGQLDEAEHLAEQAVRVRKKVLGEEHPDTLASMAEFAAICTLLDRWKEAEQMQVQILHSRMRLLGEEHPRTLDTMISLAFIYLQLGQLNEAGELFHKAIGITERTLGNQHPDIRKYRMGLKFIQAQREIRCR
ncbi:hypothetical protein FRC11_010361 [Ceratobasidium sp. 423]|nr:hypothetical protein FRC11_010361 [Ceratobasidium sp. 423]